MSENFRKTLLRYVITTVVAAAVTVFLIFAFGFDKAVDPADKYRILTDSFTIPGAILTMIAVLIRISKEGIFDGISYALRYAGSTLIPFLGIAKPESYYDYRQKKKEKGRIQGYSFLLYVGIAFLVISAVFCILYVQTKK